MNVKRTTIYIMLIGTALSCGTQKKLFMPEIFSDFAQLKISTVEKFEHRNNAQKIILNHLITLGESIYPNQNKYQLEKPLMYNKRENHFQLETDYYYSWPDSLVRVIMYEWTDLPSAKSDTAQKFQNYQSKFNQLNDCVTSRLGKPIRVNIVQDNAPLDETFRDEVKWRSTDGMHAYLFMLGNNKSGYRKIRLAIYKY